MHHVKSVEIPVVPKNTSVNTPQLGPVGGRLVAEVFLGLMYADSQSLLSLHRNWMPPNNPHYRLKDFVNDALGN